VNFRVSCSYILKLLTYVIFGHYCVIWLLAVTVHIRMAFC